MVVVSGDFEAHRDPNSTLEHVSLIVLDCVFGTRVRGLQMGTGIRGREAIHDDTPL